MRLTKALQVLDAAVPVYGSLLAPFSLVQGLGLRVKATGHYGNIAKKAAATAAWASVVPTAPSPLRRLPRLPPQRPRRLFLDPGFTWIQIHTASEITPFIV